MKPALVTLAEGLRLAVSLSGEKPGEVREAFRQALLDGVIHAEGQVERPLYFNPEWERVTREFWTSMPDWHNNSATVDPNLRAADVHVQRADVERHFASGMRHVLAAELAEQPALWRLGGVETAPSDNRGWLLPDAMQEFCPAEFARWREAAIPGPPSRRDLAGDLGHLGAAIQRLREDLEDGVLIATGVSDGGKVIEIKAASWNYLTALHLYEFSQSVITQAGKRLTDVRVRAGRVSGGSIRLEWRCTEWFREQIRAGKQPASRHEMYERALREVDTTLSERAFVRVWNANAPTAWKQPGKRKRNRRA